MSREVDIKALVSHIVRGDGVDKCRICMGDTSEGQVYLGDTVMMDGERPVTLAELLEVLTGVEVEFDGGLPQGLCRPCSESALAAITFRQLCKESVKEWADATTFLSHFDPQTDEKRMYYIFYNGDERAIIEDNADTADVEYSALRRLNARFQEEVQQKPSTKQFHSRGGHSKKSLRPSRKWNCPDCGKKFALSIYLNMHLKNSMKRACRDCREVLPKTKLPQHLRDVHGKAVMSCEYCHQIFGSETLMYTHINKTHGIGTLQCKVCGVGFAKERALTVHSYSHALFHCPCGKYYENRKCYMYHQKECDQANRTTKKNEYICDHCGNKYSKKPSLRIHIIQKHLHVLPYVCEMCGKRTSTIGHLRSHEKIHVLERKIFQCYCGATMRTELGFQLHQRIHTGERPYECDECGDKFLSASRRLDHIKRRHRSAKDMPHGCTECTARFVRPFELKKHYMSVHPKVNIADRFAVTN